MSGPAPLLAGIVIVVAAAAVGAWLLTRDRSDSAATSTAVLHVVTPLGPIVSTERGLAGFSGALHQPIYWAGPVAGARYELTETRNGDSYVRYLPPGVKVGDPRAAFLIVATYPFPHALAALKAAAHGDGTTLPNGTFVLPDASDRKSLHLAFPNVDYQVEVYDPDPARARAVATSGRVRAVG